MRALIVPQQGEPELTAIGRWRLARQHRQRPALLIELPGCALGMEHRRTPLVEPASVQALGPLCELLTEQAGADGQRLFP